MIWFYLVSIVCVCLLATGIYGCAKLIVTTLDNRSVSAWKKTRCVMFNVLMCIISLIVTGVLLFIFYQAMSVV